MNWLDEALEQRRLAKEVEIAKMELDLVEWQEPSADELCTWDTSLVIAYSKAMCYARQKVMFNTKYMYGYQAAQEIQALAQQVKERLDE